MTRAQAYLWLCLPLLCGGCASLYDRSFESDNPPVYLTAMPESDPSLSKVVVQEVPPDSPPAQAGLRSGDEIIAVDGQYLRSSASRLYYELLDSFEKRMRDVEFQVQRGPKRLTTHFDARYLPLVRYHLIYRDPDGPRTVQFVKEYVSEEGYRYEALYDFGQKAKLRTSCHWWGEQLLVVEMHVLNDSLKKVLSLDPEDVVVTDRYDFVLRPLTTQEIVGRIYNVGSVNSILGSRLHWSKKKAVRLNSEINGLYWSLNKRRFSAMKIAPGQDSSGILMYEFDASQSPVTVEVRIGREKFVEKFDLRQEVTLPQIYYPFYTSPYSEDDTWVNFTAPGSL